MARKLGSRRCRSCGEVKAPEAFATSRKRSCVECHQPTPCTVCGAPCDRVRATCSPECLHEANVRSGADAGRKSYRNWLKKNGRRRAQVCPSCGVRKSLTTEHWRISLKNPDGSVKRWSPYCKPCCRAYYRAVYEMNPKWSERQRVNGAKRRQKIRERMEVDPAFAAEWRARRREITRRYEERKKKKMAELETAPAKHRGGGWLPTPPFLEWCEKTIKTRYPNEATFCEATGLSDRYLREMRSSRRFVQFDVVDETVQNDGNYRLPDVYPERFAEEVAA